jgi:hypothetical protein
MRLLWSVVGAVAALAVSWVAGGPIGAALNAPGLLLLGGARMVGALPGLHEPGLGGWIWLASILSASFWGLTFLPVDRSR